MFSLELKRRSPYRMTAELVLCVFWTVPAKLKTGCHIGIASGTQIYTQSHKYKDKNVLSDQREAQLAKLVIEDDVWVGANCLIPAGGTLERGPIVAAGSVVTKDSKP